MSNEQQFYFFGQIQPVKQKVICTVIHTPMVSVLWCNHDALYLEG